MSEAMLPFLWLMGNSAVAAVVASAGTLLVCRVAGRASLVVRHSFLHAGLFLILTAPALVFVAERLEFGLISWQPAPDEDVVLAEHAVGTPVFIPDMAPVMQRAVEPAFDVGHLFVALAGIWGVGLVFGCTRLLRGVLRLRRLLRSCVPVTDARLTSMAAKISSRIGLRRTPRLLQSAHAPVPGVAGLLRPLVILPEDFGKFTDVSCEAAMIHELAHVVRGDGWSALAQRLAAILFWWCPLVHALNRRLSEVREHLCDNFVLTVQGDGMRYAQLLVDLAERIVSVRSVQTSLGLFGEPACGLERRVQRLLQKEPDMSCRLNWRGKMLSLLFLAAAGGLLAVSGVRGQQPTDPSRPRIIIIQPGDKVIVVAEDEQKDKALRDELLKKLEQLRPDLGKEIRGHLQPDGKILLELQLRETADRAAVIANERAAAAQQAAAAQYAVAAQLARLGTTNQDRAAAEKDLIERAEKLQPGLGAKVRELLVQQPQRSIRFVIDKDAKVIKKTETKVVSPLPVVPPQAAVPAVPALPKVVAPTNVPIFRVQTIPSVERTAELEKRIAEIQKQLDDLRHAVKQKQ